MKNALFLICLLVLPANGICDYSLSAYPVVIAAEDFYPFSFQKGDTLAGISVDFIHMVFNDERVSSIVKSPVDVQDIPWDRTYFMLQKKTNIISLGVARTVKREQMFNWVQFMGSTGAWVISGKNRDDLEVINTVWDIIDQGLVLVVSGTKGIHYQKLSKYQDNGLKLHVITPDISIEEMINTCSQVDGRWQCRADLGLGRKPSAGVQAHCILPELRHDIYIASSLRFDEALMTAIKTVSSDLSDQGVIDDLWEKYPMFLP